MRTLDKLAGNALSLNGVALATASGVIFVTLFVLGLLGFDGGPYIGLFAFFLLPTLLVVGLILIPWGLARQRRRTQANPDAPAFPIVDLNRARTRRIVLLVVVLTSVNVIVLATATYKGTEMMSSNEFCGSACHTEMEPQKTAFERSAHAGIRCVDCHVGAGAEAFVNAKVNGTVQLLHTLSGRVPRPIPTPVETLSPVEESCGTCHRPERWVGDRLRIVRRFAEDEANSPLVSVLLMHVGGVRDDGSQGIHWHADPRNRVRYRSTPDRSVVHEVEVTRADGSRAVYRRPGETPAGVGEPGEWRTMDCTDCHNRTGHPFASAQDAVDSNLAAGRLPSALPHLRREAVAALTADAGATTSPGAALLRRYTADYPEITAAWRDELAEAGTLLDSVSAAHRFPDMGVGWGTYPDHRGHLSSPGCFRCHDDELETESGDYLAQDCYSCHNLLAADEEEPEILAALEG